jgi:hypothetical protein
MLKEIDADDSPVVYSLTGMFTRPNEMYPVEIGRAAMVKRR